MKLQLGRLTANHFKSFDNVVWDLRAYEPGLHYLRGQNKLDPALGSNGAGKSTLWDAVCWCLWGRTPSGLKGTDVRAWEAAKPAQVSLEANGKLVARTSSKLTIDGEPVGQQTVDRLIGMNAETFFHAVVLGQGQPLFFDLSPRDKMGLFASVLDLERWDTRADHARDKATRLEKRQAQLIGESRVMEDRLVQVNKQMANLRADADQWTDQQSRKLASLETELKGKIKRITALQKEHDQADLAYDGAMMELKLMDKDHDRLLAQINEAHLDWEKHDLGMAKIREEADQIDFDLGLNPEKCSKCGQALGDKAYREMRNRMIDRLDDLDAEVKADKRGPALLARVQELKQEEERLRATMDGFKAKADKARATLDMSTPLLHELKAFVNSSRQIEQDLKDAKNPYTGQWQDARRERDKLHDAVIVHQSRLTLLEGQIARTKFWVKGFRDVRLYVVDTLMRELEMTTNAMLPEVGLADWLVKFDIERVTKKGTTQRGINTVILSPDNDKAVRWEAWSGGEGQRLRLVGALAFADVLLRHSDVQTTLEVLDEPTQHLSGSGVRDLVEFLQARGRALERAIFFIDHRAVESSLFDSVTTVVKDSKGSRLLSPLTVFSTA